MVGIFIWRKAFPPCPAILRQTAYNTDIALKNRYFTADFPSLHGTSTAASVSPLAALPLQSKNLPVKLFDFLVAYQLTRYMTRFAVCAAADI